MARIWRPLLWLLIAIWLIIAVILKLEIGILGFKL